MISIKQYFIKLPQCSLKQEIKNFGYTAVAGLRIYIESTSLQVDKTLQYALQEYQIGHNSFYYIGAFLVVCIHVYYLRTSKQRSQDLTGKLRFNQYNLHIFIQQIDELRTMQVRFGHVLYNIGLF